MIRILLNALDCQLFHLHQLQVASPSWQYLVLSDVSGDSIQTELLAEDIVIDADEMFYLKY